MKRRQISQVLTPERAAAAYKATKIEPLQFEWARQEGKKCFACPATVVAIHEARITRDEVFAEGAKLRQRIADALNVLDGDLFYFVAGVDGDHSSVEFDEEQKALYDLGKQTWSAAQS